jgi:hypothetical protein
MNRTIKNEQEFQDFCTEIINRQYEVDPIKVDISDGFDSVPPRLRFSPTSTHDWDNEYLEILRIENVDVVKNKRYST